MKRSDCGVPIDIVIFALQKEFDCVLETHGHLSSSYGTHKKQPSRSSNLAHLRAALAALRLFSTCLGVSRQGEFKNTIKIFLQKVHVENFSQMHGGGPSIFFAGPSRVKGSRGGA